MFYLSYYWASLECQLWSQSKYKSHNTIYAVNAKLHTTFISPRKRHAFKKISQNLLDLHLHYVYVVTMTFFTLGLDQIKHVLLELYYDQINPFIAFQLWIFAFIFENLGTFGYFCHWYWEMLYFAALRFLFNIIILATALRRLPELRGYRGRRYPGQLPPSKPTIQPRRLNLPPDWKWKNIGSRREKFLDLGMPTFGRPRKISVKPLLHINN